jgi:tRNA modification GTPase
VATKADLGAVGGGYHYRISTVTGEGIDALENGLAAYVADEIGAFEDIVITRARHRDGLSRAARHLLDAIDGSNQGLELRAEHLRAAADALGRLTGRIDVEDLLDVIFRDFCIGK